MLTREGARGMEYNAWPGGKPCVTLILPFTRLLQILGLKAVNLCGSIKKMDSSTVSLNGKTINIWSVVEKFKLGTERIGESLPI